MGLCLYIHRSLSPLSLSRKSSPFIKNCDTRLIRGRKLIRVTQCFVSTIILFQIKVHIRMGLCWTLVFGLIDPWKVLIANIQVKFNKNLNFLPFGNFFYSIPFITFLAILINLTAVILTNIINSNSKRKNETIVCDEYGTGFN